MQIKTPLTMTMIVGFLAATGCVANDRDPLQAPAAPIVTAPVAGEAVRSPVTVVGTGEMDATVEVVLRAAGSEVGRVEGRVDETGAFSVDVEFDEQEIGEALQIAVVLSNAAGLSESVAVGTAATATTTTGCSMPTPRAAC